VEEAKRLLQVSIGMIEQDMKTRTWAMGDTFSMADCAAAPSLFYANMVMPFGQTYPNTAKYLERLLERPSFARVVKEAEPYLKFFPKQAAAA
jgi:glutathione S-transferase